MPPESAGLYCGACAELVREHDLGPLLLAVGTSADETPAPVPLGAAPTRAVDAPKAEYDFFLSFTKSDRVVAGKIHRALQGKQWEVCFLPADQASGTDFAVAMDKGLVTSKRLVIVLSRAYLQSKFCMNEALAHWSRDVDGSGRRILIFRVEQDAAFEGVLKNRHVDDLCGLSDAQLTERVVEVAQRAVDPPVYSATAGQADPPPVAKPVPVPAAGPLYARNAFSYVLLLAMILTGAFGVVMLAGLVDRELPWSYWLPGDVRYFERVAPFAAIERLRGTISSRPLVVGLDYALRESFAVRDSLRAQDGILQLDAAAPGYASFDLMARGSSAVGRMSFDPQWIRISAPGHEEIRLPRRANQQLHKLALSVDGMVAAVWLDGKVAYNWTLGSVRAGRAGLLLREGKVALFKYSFNFTEPAVLQRAGVPALAGLFQMPPAPSAID